MCVVRDMPISMPSVESTTIEDGQVLPGDSVVADGPAATAQRWYYRSWGENMGLQENFKGRISPQNISNIFMLI